MGHTPADEQCLSVDRIKDNEDEWAIHWQVHFIITALLVSMMTAVAAAFLLHHIVTPRTVLCGLKMH
jgi:hypothetical protein